MLLKPEVVFHILCSSLELMCNPQICSGRGQILVLRHKKGIKSLVLVLILWYRGKLFDSSRQPKKLLLSLTLP